MKKKLTKQSQSSKDLALLNNAAKLINEKNYQKAIVIYDYLIQNDPLNYTLYYNKGVCFQLNKEPARAISCYVDALQINNKFANAFENMSDAQCDLAMYDDALISIGECIKLYPSNHMYYVRLARIYIHLYRYDDAIAAATFALNIKPEIALALQVRSNALKAINHLNESISDLRHAIALDPDNAELTYNLSFDLLLNENFEDGWLCYESRFYTVNFLKNQPKMIAPCWDGQANISGKVIFICPEQGLGDQIQFARYALLLKKMGAQVIMSFPLTLVEIMKTMDKDILILPADKPAEMLPHHDYFVPMMSLPRILRTNINTIPSFNFYITADVNFIAKWKIHFANKNRLQVGLAWSGSQNHINDHNRSMALSQLLPLFDLDVDWHVVQNDVRTTDFSLLNKLPLRDWSRDLRTFDDTAALLSQLDLVITVDTSIAHLSAALGRPTIIMLPFAPDFRWLLSRNDSPWYPSVQLCRQHTPNDWTEVIKTVRAKIDQFSNIGIRNALIA